jgi:hypothetical protein
LGFRIVSRDGRQHSDAPHALGLLRPRRERPRRCRSTDQRDERASFHFDHRVGKREQCRRHGEAQYPGGLGVDDELELPL